MQVQRNHIFFEYMPAVLTSPKSAVKLQKHENLNMFPLPTTPPSHDLCPALGVVNGQERSLKSQNNLTLSQKQCNDTSVSQEKYDILSTNAKTSRHACFLANNLLGE